MDKTFAQVPLSFLDYRAFFESPIFGAWEERHHEVVAAVFDAFRPWGIGLEHVGGKQNPANLSELQMTFNLLGGRVVFSVGLEYSSVFVTNPNWGEADLIIRVAKAGTQAVLEAAKPAINRQQITPAMHLKPEGRRVSSITSRFVNADIPAVEPSAIEGYGFSIYRGNGSYVVDKSALYPDALFVRIMRTFGPDKPLEDLAKDIGQEEAGILELLNLRLD
jgi:hypothetical protein